MRLACSARAVVRDDDQRRPAVLFQRPCRPCRGARATLRATTCDNHSRPSHSAPDAIIGQTSQRSRCLTLTGARRIRITSWPWTPHARGCCRQYKRRRYGGRRKVLGGGGQRREIWGSRCQMRLPTPSTTICALAAVAHTLALATVAFTTSPPPRTPCPPAAVRASRVVSPSRPSTFLWPSCSFAEPVYCVAAPPVLPARYVCRRLVESRTRASPPRTPP